MANVHGPRKHCDSCLCFTRCDAENGSYRCGLTIAHEGPHRVVTGPSRAFFWGEFAKSGCVEWPCIKKPGHALPHSDGKGRSWSPTCGLDVDCCLLVDHEGPCLTSGSRE